jgi:hypothetical protein
MEQVPPWVIVKRSACGKGSGLVLSFLLWRSLSSRASPLTMGTAQAAVGKYFVASLLQFPQNFLDMGRTTRFHFDFDPAEIDGEIPPASMMGEVKDIGFEPGDDGEETCEGAGNVLEADRKAHDAAFAEEFPADHLIE